MSVVTAGFFASAVGPWVAVRRAIDRGELQIVEGTVEHFHPMPYGGHDTERFDVAGVHFEFSDYVITPGLHRTVSHGGPIHAGDRVRLTYLDHGGATWIVRAEIRE